MSDTIYPAIVGAIVAIVGLGAKYANDLLIARRKDRLDRVNQQLRCLYGPLYGMRHTSLDVWKTFRAKVRQNKSFFSSDPPPTLDELAQWRLWMTEVFMPLNLRMERAILENGDLILEDKMPQCFIDLCTHVAAWKPVLKSWEGGNYSNHQGFNKYPGKSIDTYVVASYNKLKKQQQELLGKLQ